MEFASHMKAALDDGSELQIVLDYNELPSRVLLPLLEQEKARHRARKARPPSLIPDREQTARTHDKRGFVGQGNADRPIERCRPGERRYLRTNEDLHGVRTELRQHPA